MNILYSTEKCVDCFRLQPYYWKKEGRLLGKGGGMLLEEGREAAGSGKGGSWNRGGTLPG